MFAATKPQAVCQHGRPRGVADGGAKAARSGSPVGAELRLRRGGERRPVAPQGREDGVPVRGEEALEARLPRVADKRQRRGWFLQVSV